MKNEEKIEIIANARSISMLMLLDIIKMCKKNIDLSKI